MLDTFNFNLGNIMERKNKHLEKDIRLETLANNLLREKGCPIEVKVRWNPRLRTTAGLAHWQVKMITLNKQLKRFSLSETNRTLRHELAHILAQFRSGRRKIQAHGSEWRYACHDLGIPAETRCHNLPLRTIKMYRGFVYGCRACGTPLHRVRPIKRPVACLKCCRKHNAGKYSEEFRFVRNYTT